jgi:hypothetical protein
VRHELFLISIIKRGREDDELCASVVALLDFNENFGF